MWKERRMENRDGGKRLRGKQGGRGRKKEEWRQEGDGPVSTSTMIVNCGQPESLSLTIC